MDDGFLDADVAGFREAVPDRAGGGGFEILRDEDTAKFSTVETGWENGLIRADAIEMGSVIEKGASA